MWTIFLKVFIEFVAVLFLFYVCFWAMRHVGSYLLDQESNPYPLHRKAKS